MVEYTLDTSFSSLADPIRRDILQRVGENELSVSEVALPYDVSLAAVSKHIKILEQAGLVTKRRRGKQQLVRANAVGLKEATDFLEQHRLRCEDRFQALEQVSQEEA